MSGLDSYDISVIREESENLKNELENLKNDLKETNDILKCILNELVKLNIR